jgi:GntR family transcriptional repressor for pyruvate dehydrogenase complex
MVESAVAALAAQRRKTADLKAMAGHLAAMDEAIGIRRGRRRGGRQLPHRHGARHAQRLRRPPGRIPRPHFSDSRKLAWHGMRRQLAHPEEAQREHRALFEAITRGDAEGAHHCAQEHLRGTAGRLGIKLALDLDRAAPGQARPQALNFALPTPPPSPCSTSPPPPSGSPLPRSS